MTTNFKRGDLVRFKNPDDFSDEAVTPESQASYYKKYSDIILKVTTTDGTGVWCEYVNEQGELKIHFWRSSRLELFTGEVKAQPYAKIIRKIKQMDKKRKALGYPTYELLST